MMMPSARRGGHVRGNTNGRRCTLTESHPEGWLRLGRLRPPSLVRLRTAGGRRTAGCRRARCGAWLACGLVALGCGWLRLVAATGDGAARDAARTAAADGAASGGHAEQLAPGRPAGVARLGPPPAEGAAAGRNWTVVVAVSHGWWDMFENWLHWYLLLGLDSQVVLIAEDAETLRRYAGSRHVSAYRSGNRVVTGL